LDHERSRQGHQQLLRLEDQERVARNLQDTVLQQLFTTGLALHRAAPRPPTRHRSARTWSTRASGTASETRDHGEDMPEISDWTWTR